MQNHKKKPNGGIQLYSIYIKKYVCTDMGRNRRIFHHSNEKKIYNGKIIIKKQIHIPIAFLLGWNRNNIQSHKYA